MEMKKTIAMILSMILMFTMLSACGTNNDPQNSSTLSVSESDPLTNSTDTNSTSNPTERPEPPVEFTANFARMWSETDEENNFPFEMA
jgi:hypothetical protein